MGLIQTNIFISKLQNSTNINQLCINEKTYLDNNYSTIGSRKYAYSLYRKSVKQNCSLEIQNIVFSYFKLNEEEITKYKNAYKEKVKCEHNSLKQIYNYKEYINKAESLINNNSFIDNVLGFAALTGRRVAEIACTASFSFDKPKHLMFTGQLKTKDVVVFDTNVVPCLMDTITLFEAFKLFRIKFDKYLKQPRLFHDNNSKNLSLAVKKHFSKYVEGNITPKDLRAIYATIACKTMKVNKKQTDQSYIADILGHSKDDLTTCNSYFDYVL